MTTVQRQTGLPPGFWVGIILILALLFLPLCCEKMKAAKYDTIPAKPQCIEKIIVQPNPKTNKSRYVMLYRDEQNDITDIIPVSESVVKYVELCKQNNIPPQLGIKLKDGQIYSIIKYKTRYRRRGK